MLSCNGMAFFMRVRQNGMRGWKKASKYAVCSDLYLNRTGIFMSEIVDFEVSSVEAFIFIVLVQYGISLFRIEFDGKIGCLIFGDLFLVNQ